MRNVRNLEEAIQLLAGNSMKMTTLDERTQYFLKMMPFEYGEPVMSDYTFAPALTWVLIYKDLPFIVYTDLDGNWQIDAQRSCHFTMVDEFIFELIAILNEA
tara:strand:+ start:28 stop:333 length:306 start_codon:yes stop_codon:yes gene_type:complete